jgi:hypothetical protein
MAAIGALAVIDSCHRSYVNAQSLRQIGSNWDDADGNRGGLFVALWSIWPEMSCPSTIHDHLRCFAVEGFGMIAHLQILN